MQRDQVHSSTKLFAHPSTLAYKIIRHEIFFWHQSEFQRFLENFYAVFSSEIFKRQSLQQQILFTTTHDHDHCHKRRTNNFSRKFRLIYQTTPMSHETTIQNTKRNFRRAAVKWLTIHEPHTSADFNRKTTILRSFHHQTDEFTRPIDQLFNLATRIRSYRFVPTLRLIAHSFFAPSNWFSTRTSLTDLSLADRSDIDTHAHAQQMTHDTVTTNQLYKHASDRIIIDSPSPNDDLSTVNNAT